MRSQERSKFPGGSGCAFGVTPQLLPGERLLEISRRLSNYRERFRTQFANAPARHYVEDVSLLLGHIAALEKQQGER